MCYDASFTNVDFSVDTANLYRFSAYAKTKPTQNIKDKP